MPSGNILFWAEAIFGPAKSIMDEDDDSVEDLFSAYLRIGDVKSVYADASFLHRPPIYSGSFLRIGMGFNPIPGLGLWLGGGWGLYDKGGLVVKSDIRLQQNLNLDALLRLGGSEGVAESATGVGLTYKIRH